MTPDKKADKARIEREAKLFLDNNIDIINNSLKGESCLLSYIAGATAEREREQWISVDKELPESGVPVLCIDSSKKRQWVGFYTKGKDVEVAPDEDFDIDVEDDNLDHGWLKPGWYEEEETPQSAYDFTYLHRTVTHWMPLPSPPKE